MDRNDETRRKLLIVTRLPAKLKKYERDGTDDKIQKLEKVAMEYDAKSRDCSCGGHQHKCKGAKAAQDIRQEIHTLQKQRAKGKTVQTTEPFNMLFMFKQRNQKHKELEVQCRAYELQVPQGVFYGASDPKTGNIPEFKRWLVSLLRSDVQSVLCMHCGNQSKDFTCEYYIDLLSKENSAWVFCNTAVCVAGSKKYMEEVNRIYEDHQRTTKKTEDLEASAFDYIDTVFAADGIPEHLE